MYATVGQSLEFRCITNSTSTFNRVEHVLENGTREMLISNEHINNQFNRSEVHVIREGQTNILKISPVRVHSAGVYTCEDDVSSPDHNKHLASVRVHVNGI